MMLADGLLIRPAAMQVSPATIEVTKVCRRAGGQWLLKDVSFVIHGGDRIAITGPSGSGKTLLLRAIAKLDPIDSGEIRWNGSEVRSRDVPAYRSRVIYLHQRPALVAGSVEDNVRQPYRLKSHQGRCFDRAVVESLLTSLGRDASFLKKRQADVSGGESQITAVLRAVLLDPQVLLLDEPTSALDPAATASVEALVQQWLDDQPHGRSAVWVSHDTEQLRRVANQVFRMRQGRLDSVS